MGKMERKGSDGDGGLGEFPSGEFPVQGEQTAADQGEGSDGGAQEPGFGDGASGGDGGMPDLSDEPSLEEAMASLEDAMGEGEAGGDSAGGATGGGGETGAQAGAYPGSSGAAGGIPGLPPGTYGSAVPGSGSAGSGPLTPAEQVAILDGQLERGAGEFDAMILEEQMEQRRSTRERAGSSQASGGSGSGSGAYDEGGIASAGPYSTGGGMGGVSGGGAGIPQNTAKYPPPGDIPSGSDDDVVARQLREAAMREPDPALREKLWQEYRKYKGIE